jgi:hypothetical protein
MRVKIEGVGGLAKEIERSLARSVTAAVRENTEAVKADLRRETAAAYKGNRLPMAWRSKVYPARGDSVDAAGTVEVRRTAAKVMDLAFRGGVIRARGGRWLAIPLPEAGRWGIKRGMGGMGVTVNTRGARERITPEGFEHRTGMRLRFVPDSNRRAFLAVDNAQLTRGIAAPYRGKGRGSRLYGPAGQTIFVFILVRQFSAKKRMDANEIIARAHARMPGMLARFWKD